MKKYIKIFLVIIFFALTLGTMEQKVNAANFSTNIDAIDESKYPGFKSKIKQLQKTYPNIQILYTGLDWNTVIKNEYNYVHGRNLVSTSLGDEWICQECKNNGKLYDSGLYCASEDAVKYMMDARNFLNTTDIFQFQKLDTAVGTDTAEIKKVLQMQKVTYLQNDEKSILAFATVAKNKKLNAYHLITRVIQEQGRNGNSVLSSGNGYTGNGYNEYGKGYYNLFSIGATKSSSDPTYKIYINALDRAMNENPKWNSRDLSILGGGNFVGNSYIDVGQNTLYLQKFDVYNKNGNLYWHQYMQNLFAAQNEAKTLYSSYQITGIQNSKDFVFIVPVYENMPTTVSTKPGEKYSGEINTDLQTMKVAKNAAGKEYIYGKILIAEWINGVANTPKRLPEMTLKSTDGKYSQKMYVKHEGGLEYYYDRVISNLDTSKEYYIEVRLTNSNNISNNKVQKAKIKNIDNIGSLNNKEIVVTNNIIKFISNGYKGEINTDLQTMKVAKNTAGREYIYGEILIAEWVNGVANTPKGIPEMTLKSKDGTYSQNMYVKNLGGLKYYYDRVIYNLNTNKEYYIEVKLTNKNNISNKKMQNAQIRNVTNIGTLNGRSLVVANNVIKFNKGYIGEINTDLQTMKVGKNAAGREYIYGEILIAEWINGVANTPKGIPEMILKSTDGTYSQNMYVKNLGGLKYYYDRVIYNLDTNKEYYIEVKLTNKDNISDKKIQKAKMRNIGEIGTLNSKKISVSNNTIKFKVTQYKGEINTDLQTMKVGKNAAGREYIYGEILIAEWINGVANTPNGIPEMTLKSTDGTYSQKMYVKHEGGLKYYYDRVIYNLDINKEYYIEVKLTNSNNVSNKKIQNANIRVKGQIGTLKSYKINVSNNKINFIK